MKSASASGLKPQDVLLLLKLAAVEGKGYAQSKLAAEIGVSQAEISYSLQRLIRSNLVNESKQSIYRLAAREFLVHAIKYLYPAEISSYQRGLATAHSAEPLKGKLVTEQHLELVWPDPEGKEKGMAVKPIYETVPMACRQDRNLYQLMALLDSLRVGSPRERKMAELELSKRILKGNA